MVLLARPARRLITSRPPLFRTRHGVRQFSFGVVAAETNDLASYVAVFPATYLESLHGMGFPWYAALPLSAVLIRTLVIYPFFQKPLRDKLADRAQMQPLIDAKMGIKSRRVDAARTNVPPPVRKSYLTIATLLARAEMQIELFNRWPVPFRVFSFLTTIMVSDALRRLMGAKEGLLKFLLGPLDWTVTWLFQVPGKLREFDDMISDGIENVAGISHPRRASQKAPEEVNSSPPQAGEAASTIETSQDVSSALETGQDAVSGLPTEEAASTVAGHINSPWFDLTLTTEGFSWCQDLTASDPTFILPVMFSGTFLASIYFAPRIAGATTKSDGEPPKPTNMQRIGMTIATLSFIPALHMPAGLLLYFIANMLTNNLQSRWLAWTRPIYPAPTACKRPVRMKRSRELPEDFLGQQNPAARHSNRST